MSKENGFKGQALNYVVIVKEKIVKNETASGFDLTSEVDKNIKYRTGIIVSVGTECPRKDDNTYTVKEGDEVMFDAHKTSDLVIDGITYRCMYYADLMLMI